MLQSLSPLSAGSNVGEPVQVPAPPKFRGVTGKVYSASVIGSMEPLPGSTESQKAGLRYEQQVNEHLKSCGGLFIFQPKVQFRDDSGARLCVPDGIIYVGNGRLAVVEIKLQHMPEAWWQLKRLYEPVVRSMRDAREVICLEVCRTYDPVTPFPCETSLVYDLEDFLHEATCDKFGVMPWRP